MRLPSQLQCIIGAFIFQLKFHFWIHSLAWCNGSKAVVALFTWQTQQGVFSLTLTGLSTKSNLYTHMSGIHLKLSRLLTSDVWNLHRCFPAPFERTNCEATQLLPLPEMIALSASRSDQLLYQTKHLWCPIRDAIIRAPTKKSWSTHEKFPHLDPCFSILAAIIEPMTKGLTSGRIGLRRLRHPGLTGNIYEITLWISETNVWSYGKAWYKLIVSCTQRRDLLVQNETVKYFQLHITLLPSPTVALCIPCWTKRLAPRPARPKESSTALVEVEE